ncbi:A/G-specific adenine glycosylase [Rariglobus hedericola]|uniref:A/G-specific adenine glycosylase n=1 Tax=Rariglobus hedericola TaxID=2597822 RepID=A0A556QMF2_9BACT|nr:A/G-specific adenine glycosylase [Rariglobus hedericola]TSJ77772.1 A/G-specific adenine glycosylase [Rariglobus hedericola]
MAQSPLIAQKTEFQRALLAWYRVHQRKLPWRTAPSLYKTVVSELMLQQTQVKTVLPYLARWVEVFPNFKALAAASEEQVVKNWEGLGYYTRARNLHKLAKALIALPAIPETREAWMELPGIGPYTSAAITSISFGTRAAVVDGNVVRILTRLTADATPFRDSASASKALAPLADALLNHDEPGDHNQAMMELGATVCHRNNPLCTICPVLTLCSAGRNGDPESYPKLAAKVIEQRSVSRVWCVQKGKLLLHRTAGDARRLANMHELPAAEHLGLDESAFAGPDAKLIAKKKRGITRFAITESIYELPASRLSKDSLSRTGLVWVAVAEIDTLTLSGPHKRWVSELLRS